MMQTKKKKAVKAKKRGAAKKGSRTARLAVWVLGAAFAVWSGLGTWYAHHAPAWLDAQPRFISEPLLAVGDRVSMVTDALGWTGHDAVYDFDEAAPTGQVFFAGAPVRKAAPAPADIVPLRRGEFMVGWSPSLRHPVWAAYHVPREAKFVAGKRPSFKKDRSVPSSPASSAYDRSGYDRGHMVPNRAIATRFGPEEQAKTFLMSNISPQRPALNRGPWREVEQRVCDLWTARYGELWVIVGAFSEGRPSGTSGERMGDSGVDVPEFYYMLIVGQTEDGVRALAMVMPQGIGYHAFPVHSIVTIAELERRTGLEFLPDLPGFLARPLKNDRPTRLWPVNVLDIVRLLLLRFS